MKATYDELVEQYQDKRIGALQFVTNGDYAHIFIDWCYENSVDPSDETAEQFLDELEHDMLKSQIMPMILFI